MTVKHYSAAHDEVVVYDLEGNEIVTSRLNALDLTRSNRAAWNPPAEVTEEELQEEELQEEEQEEEEEQDEVEEDAEVQRQEESEEAEEVVVEETIQFFEDEVKDVAGDVASQDYLKSFSVSALRTMIEERFNHKFEGYVKKEELIAKFLELSAV